MTFTDRVEVYIVISNMRSFNEILAVTLTKERAIEIMNDFRKTLRGAVDSNRIYFIKKIVDE